MCCGGTAVTASPRLSTTCRRAATKSSSLVVHPFRLRVFRGTPYLILQRLPQPADVLVVAVVLAPQARPVPRIVWGFLRRVVALSNVLLETLYD